MQALPISEARKQLFTLRDQVVSQHDFVLMTHKQGNVVMISQDEWETYMETMRLLRDKEALQALLQSFVDHDAGLTQGKAIDDIFADLT